MRLPASGYLDVKRDTLAGVANYDWFVGSGYDGGIPTSVFVNGFGTGLDDLSLLPADHDPLARKNLPSNRQNLHDAEREDGSTTGYYRWSPEEVALDLAPIIPNQRMTGINRIASSIAGYHMRPKGHELQSSVPARTYVVTDVPNIPIYDPGNRFGVLFDAPALGPYKRGAYTVVPDFY